jgi:hypothetical protein
MLVKFVEALRATKSPQKSVEELAVGEALHVGAGGLILKLTPYGQYLVLTDNIPATALVVEERDLCEYGARSEMFNLHSRYSLAAPGTTVSLEVQ